MDGVFLVDSVGSNEGISAVGANGGAGCEESGDVEQCSTDDPETSPNVPGEEAFDRHAEGGGDDTEVLARYGGVVAAGMECGGRAVVMLYCDMVLGILVCV